jgi:hypothetical protein
MKIEEVIINEEKVYLKKDRLGWHEVHSIKKDLTQPIRIGRKINWKNINWKNLLTGGSWIKFGIVVGFVILLILSIIEVSNVYKVANECLNQTKIFIPTIK